MSRLVGAAGARLRAKMRAKSIDQNVISAISKTVDEVHASGIANIDSMVETRTGKLRKNYKKAVRKKEMLGIVGYISPSARKGAFYARFVHDGTSHSIARPFHDFAVAENEASHSRRMTQALRATLKMSASPSALARSGGALNPSRLT